MTKLLETAKIIPAVNQVECHPHQAQPELLAFCQKHGIILEAYTPSGYGYVAEDPVVRGITQKHGVSSAQVCLAWLLARGMTAVPRSSNAERQKANLCVRRAVFCYRYSPLSTPVQGLPKLDNGDLEALEKLHRDVHYCQYPGPQKKDGEKAALGWTYSQLGW